MSARVSQNVVEVIVLPAQPNLRVSQDAVEVIYSLTNHANALISQSIVEVILLPATTPPITTGRKYGPILQAI